jgi:asparagine synthetase B (glutamine-hydrolysing)
MCGIAEQVTTSGRMPDRATVERMCAALAHGGPDFRGVYIDDGACLGI